MCRLVVSQAAEELLALGCRLSAGIFLDEALELLDGAGAVALAFGGDGNMAEAEKKKDGRGGARAGCGRKATGRQKIYATTAIAGTPEEIEKLKKAAADAGKSVSRFVLDMI